MAVTSVSGELTALSYDLSQVHILDSQELSPYAAIADYLGSAEHHLQCSGTMPAIRAAPLQSNSEQGEH